MQDLWAEILGFGANIRFCNNFVKLYRPKLKSGIDANGRMYHTPGGGSIAVRSTDMLRFGYLMLHEGRWGKQQIFPREIARLCGRKQWVGLGFGRHARASITPGNPLARSARLRLRGRHGKL